jgi:pentalenene oxygenase
MPPVRPSPLSARSFFRDPVGYACSRAEDGNGVALRAGRERFVVVTSPAEAWSVLVTDAARYEPGKWKQRARRVVGDTLNTLHGSEHRERRLLLQPALARDRVAAFADSIPAFALAATDSWSAGQRIQVRAAFDPLSLAIGARFLLGVELRAPDELARRLGELMVALPRRSSPGRRAGSAQAAVLDEIRTLVAERRAAGPADGNLLDRLLASGLPDDTIAGEVLAFLLAATDEPPSALAALVYLLGRDPARQRRLQLELDEALAGRPASLADQARLPYTTAVVREAMRLFPPARHVDRCPVSAARLGARELRAGTRVVVSPLVLHHLPSVWDEPETFRPERWLDADLKLPRGAYLPFGAGPHSCIGEPLATAIVFLVLATLAVRWSFLVDEAAPRPEPRQPPLLATLAIPAP